MEVGGVAKVMVIKLTEKAAVYMDVLPLKIKMMCSFDTSGRAPPCQQFRQTVVHKAEEKALKFRLI